jgi:signal transduction histidine kinase
MHSSRLLSFYYQEFSSLSYDIVKAHGGSIKINSESEVYTEFIIQLPDETTKNSETDE